MANTSSAAMSGGWNDYTFKMVETSDYPQIEAHLTTHFYTGESIHKLANLPEDDDYPAFSTARILSKLNSCQETSFLAIHAPTGILAGLQLSFKYTKEEAEQDARSPKLSSQEGVPAFRKVYEYAIAPLEKPRTEIFEKFNVSCAAFNFLVSTTPEFRRQGLASEMFRRMLILLPERQIPLVFSYYSSPYSRRCAEKAGFQVVAKSELNSARAANGELVFPNATASDFISLMALKL